MVRIGLGWIGMGWNKQQERKKDCKGKGKQKNSFSFFVVCTLK